MLPLLEGIGRRSWPDRTLYIQAHRGDRAGALTTTSLARNQRWKLLRASGFGREEPSADAPFELYDMERDALEKRDMAAEHPDVVADMKRAYDRWFDDVSSTRPDNYEPPRILVGAAAENPTVLTRQDWRRLSEDGGWERGSRGTWLLRVTPGDYDVRLRFRESDADERVTLEVGDGRWTKTIEAGATECSFDNVTLAGGDVQLTTSLAGEGRARAAHHVIVRKR